RPSLVVSVFCGYRRKLQAPSLSDVIRQREQQRYRSQLHGLPLFTWPGAPRRAARTSTSPSKPLRPLVKEQGPTMRRGGCWVNRGGRKRLIIGLSGARRRWRGRRWLLRRRG